MKQKAAGEEEEEEKEEDWTAINTPPYSSGESEEGDFSIANFKEMDEEQRNHRCAHLWHIAKVKAIGGARVINTFQELNENITMFGASRRVGVEIEEEI